MAAFAGDSERSCAFSAWHVDRSASAADQTLHHVTVPLLCSDEERGEAGIVIAVRASTEAEQCIDRANVSLHGSQQQRA